VAPWGTSPSYYHLTILKTFEIDEAVFLEILEKKSQPVIERFDLFSEFFLQTMSNFFHCFLAVTPFPDKTPHVIKLYLVKGVFQTRKYMFFEKGMLEFRLEEDDQG